MTQAPGLRPLFVTGSLAHGGAERLAVALAGRLRERGHECHVAWIKDDAALLERLGRGPGTAQCLGAARYLDHRAVADLARLIARHRPTALVAQNPYALLYASAARALARRSPPVIATFHSNRLLGAKEQLQMAAYRPLFWLAACTVFVCEAQRRRWRRLGVLSRRTEVIYNGVDTDAFRGGGDTPRRREMRRSLGYGDGDYVIGVTAALRPEKNHVQLVEAVAQLRGLGLPARALLIGDGATRAAIEARARAFGIAPHVLVTGYQQDVRPYVDACDTMALCSLTEALPLAAIEAMALGKPVVHSAVGGAPEIVEPGVNGELFPAGDTGALVARLAGLADPSRRLRFGANARRVAETRFSERAMVDRYEALLRELAPGGARAGRAEAPRAGAPVVLLLGPRLDALSGVSAHLRALLGSRLAASHALVHFPVGREGRGERLPARIARLLGSPFALAREVRRRGAAVVHVNTSMNAGAFWRDLVYMAIARRLGARVVCQVHGGALPQEFLGGLRPLHALLRRALGLADVVVVLAQAELEAYRRFLPGRPVERVPNGVACEHPGAADAARHAGAAPLRLLFLGRLVRGKGLYETLDALAATDGAARLTIAGGGPEEAGLRLRVAELGLGGLVEFAGPVGGEEKARLLRRADASVLASHAEGLPYALLESLAAGTPVIATPVGAIPDVVEDGVHGLLVPPRDAAALAQAMRRLAGDRGLLARMGAACLARARETCSVERLAARFDGIYASLAAAGAGSSPVAG